MGGNFCFLLGGVVGGLSIVRVSSALYLVGDGEDGGWVAEKLVDAHS